MTVRYFAGARAAAGVAEESVPAATLAQLVGALESAHGPELGKVLAVASYLVDGLVCHDREQPLGARSTVDVLPPFAGG